MSENKVSWDKHKAGPIDSIKVYWVGHSLMEGKQPIDGKKEMLLTYVGRLAEFKNYKYQFGDHTRWGMPLSGMWRGKNHVWGRDATPMLPKRIQFQKDASTYDAIVLTEGVPIGGPIKEEYTSYYVQQFYCTLMNANPNARVYLYETWVGYQGGGNVGAYGPAAAYDWSKKMIADRKLWEQAADQAMGPKIPEPGLFSKVKSFFAKQQPPCAKGYPIFIVPTGTAKVKLLERLNNPQPEDHFVYADGRKFEFSDIFLNPYVDWPKKWPLSQEEAKKVDEKAIISKLTLRNPKNGFDDIHPTALSIYYNSLVHFATLYRTSPVGLYTPDFIGEKFGKTLQCIAWETVLHYERSGVKGDLNECRVN